MKIGIFGGTFNPIHNGHINLLNAFDKQVNFDKIIVIISNVPPHKSNEGVIDGYTRIKMTQLAFEGYKKVEVSDIELKMEGKSFTYNTLTKLKATYQNDQLYFIMGSDMFLSFEKWYKFNEIFDLTVLCTGSRDETTFENLNRQAENLISMGAQCIVINHQVIEVSSTLIRSKIKAKQDVTDLVPQNVFEYIKENKLYV